MRVVTFALSDRVKTVLVLWCLAEVLAFIAVVQLTGIAGAMMVGLATSAIGFVFLKRAGAAALLKLRATLEGRGSANSADMLGDTLAAAGALALILPGFLSDLIGAALMLPALRMRIARRIGARARRSAPLPGTIDLDPDEWRHADPAGRPVSKV